MCKKRFIVKSSIIKELRMITGEGMLKCKEALEQSGNIEKAIKYLREHSNEPNIEGLSEERFDILSKEGQIIESYKTLEELIEKKRNPCMYTIRFVNKVGNYYYVK